MPTKEQLEATENLQNYVLHGRWLHAQPLEIAICHVTDAVVQLHARVQELEQERNYWQHECEVLRAGGKRLVEYTRTLQSKLSEQVVMDEGIKAVMGKVGGE